MVVQGNDRLLRPSISRQMRFISWHVKSYRDGMVLSTDLGMHSTVFKKANKLNMDTKEWPHIFLPTLQVNYFYST